MLADYGTDQFSSRINDTGNDIIVKPLNSFSFKAVTPFQTKFKTTIKKHNKFLHQQSLLLLGTDVRSDDDEHIYTRIPKNNSLFSIDEKLHEENECFSTINKSTPNKRPKCYQSQLLLYTCTNEFKSYNTLSTNNTFL